MKIIHSYKNRKFYDTDKCRYIKLSEILMMISEKQDFIVYDRKDLKKYIDITKFIKWKAITKSKAMYLLSKDNKLDEILEHLILMLPDIMCRFDEHYTDDVVKPVEAGKAENKYEFVRVELVKDEQKEVLLPSGRIGT